MVIKSIVKIAIGGGAAQCIQFLALPLLSLLYAPQEMGGYFSVTAMAAVATVFSTFQLQHAIPNKDSLVDVHEIARTIFILAFCLLIVALFCAWLVPGEVAYFLIWTVVFAVSTALTNVIKSLLVRGGLFNLINIATFIRAIGIVAGQIVFYYLVGGYGLFIGFVLGDILAAAGVFYICRKSLVPMASAKGYFCRVLKFNKDFSLYGTVQEFISVSTLSLPLIIVTALFGGAVAGQFGMAQRLMLPPAAIVLGSIVSVIHHVYGRQDKFAILESPFFRYRNIIIFLICACPIAYYSGGFLSDLVLGPQWAEAVRISQYMAVWGVFLIASAPFRACCRMYSMQYLQLYVDACALTIMGAIYFCFTYWGWDFEWLVLSVTFAGILQNLIISVLILLAIHSEFREGSCES